MNDAEVPINDGDYVLYRRNQDIENCCGKIVVARLSDETGVPQLVVKKLIKITTTLRNKDNYTEEVSVYLLRSFSKYVNEKTGQPFKDIIISDDEQVKIIGEVVAVANRRKDVETTDKSQE